MFEGSAEQAMRFYVSLFGNSEIKQVEHFGTGEPGAEGSIKRGEFTLAGRRIHLLRQLRQARLHFHAIDFAIR